MAFYLVTAIPRADLTADLEARLAVGEFESLRAFGKALSGSLREARRRPDGTAVWEEEDYCRPPLEQERSAVLDKYFDGIQVEPVSEGEGWKRISGLPAMFPALR